MNIGDSNPVLQMGNEVAIPALEGAATRLRPVSPSDLEFLYSICTAAPNGFRWRFRGSIPDRVTFANSLNDGILVQFLVERKATSEAVGLVAAYGASHRDGYAYIAAVSDPRLRGSGVALDGLSALIEYVFTLWPMRKLYFDALEFNYSQFERATLRVAHEEGRLRDHIFHGGKYWDLITGAIYAEAWHAHRHRLSLMVPAESMREGLDFASFGRLIFRELEIGLQSPNESDRLVEDLGFDSLMMVELATIIAGLTESAEFEMMGEVETLGQAFLWYCTASSMPAQESARETRVR